MLLLTSLPLTLTMFLRGETCIPARMPAASVAPASLVLRRCAIASSDLLPGTRLCRREVRCGR